MASQLYDRSSPCSPGFTSPGLTLDELWSLHSLDDDDDGKRRKFEVGVCFHPNNDELIGHFLKKRVLGIDLQELRRWIMEVDVLKFEPPDLPAFSAVQSEDLHWYFFYRQVDYGKGKGGGNVRTLKSGKGKWSITGNLRKVKSETTNQVIGTKRTLTYKPAGPWDSPEVKAKSKGKGSTEWVIHEYSLLPGVDNPDKYVIVKLIKKGGIRKPLNLSHANGEAINFPEEVCETRLASIAIDPVDNAVASTTTLNESSQSSFMCNTEPFCNYYDPNQTGIFEQELSCELMSSSLFLMDNPPTEVEASCGYYNSTFDDTIGETLAASIASADNVLATIPLNEISQFSFIQNGIFEQALSCQPMSSSPFLMDNPPTELEASCGYYNSTFDDTIGETLAASIASADNVLATTPLNEISQFSFIQNGIFEQELSCQPMSSSPFLMGNPPTELEASCGYYNSTFDDTIGETLAASIASADNVLATTPLNEISQFSFIQNGIFEQELSCQPMSSSPFLMDNPTTELEASSGCHNSTSDNTIEQRSITQSLKFVEKIQQPPQGCNPIAHVTTVEP